MMKRLAKAAKHFTNLRITDDINALAEEEQELEGLVDSTKPARGISWRSVRIRPN